MALQWWTWLLDRMKAYDGLTAGSPAHVHQAPVMYEPIADPFNRLSVHISHQRAPVTTVIAIANIAILIISAIMIYTLLPSLFAKISLQSFKLHLYFHFSQKNCPSLLSLSTVTVLQPIRVITSKKNDPTIMISIWSLLLPYL